MRVLLICLFGLLHAASAPDRDWPSVLVAPAIDVPLRDAAITRGPDGAWYLTGTQATNGDFANTRNIRLWRSTDLKTWNDLGVVYDLASTTPDPYSGWARMPRLVSQSGEGAFAWGIQGPELHHLNGDWWICFSVNGQGTGLLKSTTGKPEGPYLCHARITARGGDPSLFRDDDGTVYWVMDGGRIARLTPDLKALAEQPRLIVPKPDPVYEHAAGKGLAANDGSSLSDHPGRVGNRGAFLFKSHGRYFLTAADINGRLGTPCDDTFIAYADRLDGPWSERHLMVPHGSAITVFTGPRTSAVTAYRGPWDGVAKVQRDGEQLYAASSGGDARAILVDRPGFLPLEWLNPQRWDVYFFKHAESFPRKPQHVFTEKGPWAEMKPLNIAEEMRDMSVSVAADGNYYLHGSVCSRPGELMLYRSTDLITWTELPVPWRYEDIEWLPKRIPPVKELDKKGRFCQIFWGVRLWHLHGDWYLTFGIFKNDQLCPDNRGVGALKSTSGTPNGPWVSLGRIGGQLGVDPGPLWPDFFTGTDGKLYAANTLDWKLHVAEVDLAKPGWAWNYKPVDQGGAIFAADGFGSMDCILGRYLYTAVRWGGPVANVHGSYAEAGKHYGTYDLHYATSTSPWGPVQGFPQAITRIGAGNIFQDRDGGWWGMLFGNDHTGPWWQQPGLLPLTIREIEGMLQIEPDLHPDPRRRRIMGAGTDISPPTVLQTLLP